MTQQELPKLKERCNFGLWKFRIKLLLEEKGLESVLGSEKVEKKDDAKARSIIVQCLDDKYIQIIKDCETAAEMISKLEDIFERKTVFNKLRLKRQLISMKCGASEKLQDYYMKFDNLVGDLMAIGCKIDEMDQVCYLLSSMPLQYDNVITSIETISTEKTISIEFVKSRLLDAELKYCQKETMAHESNNMPTAFITCYGCGRKGHIIKDCHNNQNNHRGRGMMRGRIRGRGQGVRRQFSRGRAYTTGTDERTLQDLRNNSTETEVSTQESSWLFTANSFQEDCNNFVNNVNDNISFIIDSGASENLIKDCYKKYMFDIKQVKEIKIYIANGDYLIGKQRGKITVNCKNKILTIECLIVENLTYNLLSVRQLISRGFEVRFHEDLVSICKGNDVIYGKLKSRLYVINLDVSDKDKCLLTDTLWHKRLGHLNRKVLKILGLPVSEEMCNSCAEGKYSRRTLREARKYTKQIGDLVHSDFEAQ